MSIIVDMKSLTDPQQKADLIVRLKTIHCDSPRKWGRMSSHQMICHLSDSFQVAMGERPARFAPNLINQTLIKWIALRAPLQWPKGVKTSPEVNQEGDACTRPRDFEQDLQRLFTLIERFAATQRDFEFHPHPMFGHLSEWEWLRWGYLHMDHHLRQFGA